MKKNNKYILHIKNKLTGDISPGDQKELTAWLEADPKNQKEYDLIAKIIREGKQMQFPADPDMKDEWKAFEFPKDPLPKRKTFYQPGSALERIASLLKSPRLAYAAFIIFIIGASAFWYHESTHSIEIFSTANHQQKEKTLSDGSTVYLNCETELSYPRKFAGKTRRVTLKGEAFFDVAKSKSPFIVQTSEGTVTVLGTRFNIWTRDLKTRVFVKEGRVRLAADDTTGSVILTRNLMSEISENQPPLKPWSVNAQELLGWRSGKLVFNHTKLSELAGEIGRWYDVDIFIKNKKLETKTITAVFDRLPLKKVLYSISSTLDIQYKYENGSYIFYDERLSDDQ
ncbi:FecR domain-containing protein [candidate division KSB1 bacterium]|nr:FecR domain-containing protein [candidate division KSB1 bacterium]